MFDFNWVTLVLFNKARFQKSWPNRLIRCVKHDHGLPLLVRISDVAIFGISESVLRIVCPTKLKDKWFMLSGDLLKGVNRMSHYSASRTTYSWKLEFQLRVSQQFRKAMRSSFYIPKLFINMLCQLLPGPNIIYKSIVGYMTMKSKTLYEIVTLGEGQRGRAIPCTWGTCAPRGCGCSGEVSKDDGEDEACNDEGTSKKGSLYFYLACIGYGMICDDDIYAQSTNMSIVINQRLLSK